MKQYSWEFGSAKKHIDKSCFVSNETGIPQLVREYFGVSNLDYQDLFLITLVFGKQSYRAKIENPTTPDKSRKTRMVWGSDFVALLRLEFSGWEEAFLRNKNFSKDRRPLIIFEKIDDGKFEVSFIPIAVGI